MVVPLEILQAYLQAELLVFKLKLILAFSLTWVQTFDQVYIDLASILASELDFDLVALV